MDEWVNVIAELESLDSQPGNLTRKQEQRHATLLAKSAGLRQGMRLEELRRWEQDRLLQAAGLPKLPETGRLGRLDDETEAEWRSFGKGDPVRPSRVPKDSEVRANEAGTQSLTFTQEVPGGAFVPQGYYGRSFESMKQYDKIFDSQFCMHCYQSVKLQRCFECDSCRDCADSYFCHNCENVQNGIFCFNAKNLRYAVGNSEVGREKFLEVKKRLLEYLGARLKKERKLELDIFNLACRKR